MSLAQWLTLFGLILIKWTLLGLVLYVLVVGIARRR